jgi:hypothetical protein
MNVAFLLDADNLSSASDVEQVFAHLRRLGAEVTVRRAYGGLEKLAGMKDVLRQHAVRSFVNQGKGTTDASLVIDAMDLLHHDALPGMVAIASSDADFAPLAVRLREDGVRVLCFALRDKADADALALVYDEVIYLDGGARTERTERSGRVERDLPAPAPARKAPVRKAPAPKVAAAKAPARAPAPRALADADRVWDVLEEFPGFLDGEDIALNEVVKKLRDEKLMSRSTIARNFLRKHVPEVELWPEKEPNKLRLPRQPRR